MDKLRGNKTEKTGERLAMLKLATTIINFKTSPKLVFNWRKGG